MKRAKLNELAVTKNISVLSGIVYNLNTSDWPLHSHAQHISLWLATVRNTLKNMQLETVNLFTVFTQKYTVWGSARYHYIFFIFSIGFW